MNSLPFPNDQRSFELILRERAMKEPNENYRMALRSAADMLTNTINVLCITRNAQALQDLNGVWSYAAKVLRMVEEAAPTPPNASAQDVRKAA